MINQDEICDNCFEEIPLERHGNSNYCSDKCQREAASKRGKKYYAASVLARKLQLNQEIMQYFFNRFGNTPIINIESQDLENAGFAWDAITGTLSHQGYEYRSIGSYHYIIFENHKTQILKL